MIVHFSKRFHKQYAKLPKRHQNAVDKGLKIFRSNPHDPSLSNHPLRGNLKGHRAIDVGFDLRIVFEEYDKYTIVIMLKVGPHREVYR